MPYARLWYSGWESNPHALTGTSPSSWRVCHSTTRVWEKRSNEFDWRSVYSNLRPFGKENFKAFSQKNSDFQDKGIDKPVDFLHIALCFKPK